ncbi:MAG TPA: hypothetical protein VFL60_10175 [Gaiellaceae bacterium]|nr:hypothetical protein [Gaiellaceae bacterium]
MSRIVRLPAWGEVMDGPWALRLRSGAAGAWLMRGEADEEPRVDCRFLAGVAARTQPDALAELGTAFELEQPPESWDEVARRAPDEPLALLVLDTDRLLADEPAQLAPLVAALKEASDRTGLRVIFQARELPLEAEAVLAEFGVAEIAA